LVTWADEVNHREHMHQIVAFMVSNKNTIINSYLKTKYMGVECMFIDYILKNYLTDFDENLKLFQRLPGCHGLQLPKGINIFFFSSLKNNIFC